MSRRRTSYVITCWFQDGTTTAYLHTATDASAAIRVGRRHYSAAVAVEVRNASGGPALATWGERRSA